MAFEFPFHFPADPSQESLSRENGILLKVTLRWVDGLEVLSLRDYTLLGAKRLCHRYQDGKGGVQGGDQDSVPSLSALGSAVAPSWVPGA